MGVQRIELNVEAIVREYVRGRTADEIAEAHHVSRDTILRRLDEVGVLKRRRRDYLYARRSALVAQ